MVSSLDSICSNHAAVVLSTSSDVSGSGGERSLDLSASSARALAKLGQAQLRPDRNCPPAPFLRSWSASDGKGTGMLEATGGALLLACDCAPPPP